MVSDTPIPKPDSFEAEKTGSCSILLLYIKDGDDIVHHYLVMERMYEWEKSSACQVDCSQFQQVDVQSGLPLGPGTLYSVVVQVNTPTQKECVHYNGGTGSGNAEREAYSHLFQV